MAHETATTSGEEHVVSPPKVSKVKEIPTEGQKATPKLVVNQKATKCAPLADETATTSGEEHILHPQKYLRSKKYLQRAKKLHQNWLLKKVNTPKGISIAYKGAMASNSYLDGEDYYIVVDDSESPSSEYVPCVNYPNDKVYPEDEKNGWVRLDEDTGPQMYINLRDPVTITWI